MSYNDPVNALAADAAQLEQLYQTALQAGEADAGNGRQHQVDRSCAAQDRAERRACPGHLGTRRRDRSRHRALEDEITRSSLLSAFSAFGSE